MVKTTKNHNCKIKTRDPRLVNFFERKIFIGRDDNLKSRCDLPIDSRINHLETEINNNLSLNPNEYIEKLESEFLINHVSNDDIDWLDENNEFMCYLIWSSINLINKKNTTPKNVFTNVELSTDHMTFNFNDIFTPRFFISPDCDILPITKKPHSSKEARVLIVNSIDSSELTISNKIQLINFLREQYSKSFDIKIYKWIDKNNEEQINWIYNYLEEKEMKLDNFTLPSLKNEYNMLISAFCLWNFKSVDDKIGSKDMFLLRLRKAWNQKKHRDNNQNKKPYNIEMSIDIGDKIAFIARSYDKKKNEIVEMLINQEYEKLN
ncbi:hypothetical protein [Moritella viscosa]|uniref:Uncharacterized protein n=1 Tax=Moritella viscosa TaxID=80854 RepID=A0A1L0AVA2_9GAMM|nr:hypothetical protein [Moritella viscosa]SGZ19828.1 Putative uncharacterized protein [Moritella viscosa]